MRFAIFGLSISSSWNNGHATTWRGVLKELHRAGHRVTFFERDVPWYASNRDLPNPDYCDLVLYEDWQESLPRARAAVAEADVAIVTSLCQDGEVACNLVLDAGRGIRAFYDIDTPRTLAALADHGYAMPGDVRYITSELIPEFDLFLSFTGGPALDELETRWHARRAAPLYCSVDPDIHHPVAPVDEFRCALGYMASYSPDRQLTLEKLLFEPARHRPTERFFVVGSMFPSDIAWPANVWTRGHLAPPDHARFYCSNRIALNVTREWMIRLGYSPSVRLFEVASCGVPLLSDWWPGIDRFFTPGEEILIAQTTVDAIDALELDDATLGRIARAARERTLAEHTSAARARELVALCADAASGGGAGSGRSTEEQPLTEPVR